MYYRIICQKMKEYKRTQFSEEDNLIKKGFSTVVGMDEVGRGSLVGPVVAAAVFISDRSFLKELSFGDSKSMGEGRREKLFGLFSSLPEIKWGIGSVSAKMVDRINVLAATKVAMRKALLDLKKKEVFADALLIDGNFLLETGLLEKSVIKGDMTIISCKIASIVAKVTRDRIMRYNSKRYPGYHFEKHKGYGTALHLEAIERLGYCPIHRTTFVVKKMRSYL